MCLEHMYIPIPYLSPPSEYSRYAVSKSNASAAVSIACMSRSSSECSVTSEPAVGRAETWC